MSIFIAALIFLIIGFLLFCCCHAQTDYDRKVSDLEQEKYLKKYK
ncbi:MAG: hypothetical protein UHS54_00135 [Lachnospiraceae bacterium]|nr:hypothetical protein [Lachnospiraceae bacterium]MEE1248097.1 hypothetical protein [Lachnospiraceae bacterium]